MGRKRLAKNKGFPPNLYQNPAGYFYYKNPMTKAQKGLGRDRAHAFSEARAANAVLATMKPSSLADWVAGKVEYTLAEWLPLYNQLWQEKVEPTPSTVKASDSYLRRLAECDFAARRLPDITTLMVAQYLEAYKVERGAPSAKQMRSKLSDVFRWAETQGLIESGRNPVTATRPPRLTVARERMSFEQFAAVRDQAPVWLRNAMNLGLVTGQRREDVLTMKFADWRDGRLHVAQGKSGGVTRLALDGGIGLAKLGLTIADVVKSCRDLIASPYLVHHDRHRGTTKPGRRVEGTGLAEAFAAARDAAGFEAKEGRTPFTFHEIRSLAERLYREERGPEFAQAILGHKNASTTARYDDLRGEWKVVSVG
ncbi:tyrosine-type recombinase/integrase [Massilia phyllosphaerae]|uniref:tyrosine-type recombinase/integrase n=1 Tax=Massilia phyllosphaerae TaxID=3106034 RepID=UPI002B1CE021|nr:tyrosine-type recombinase/integrase [Massilia sp. SGZ-792]